MGYSGSKTLATVGKGDVQVGDTENSDDLTRLNRDTKKVNKELYSGSVSTSVTATIDHNIVQNMKILVDTLSKMSESLTSPEDKQKVQEIIKMKDENPEKFQELLEIVVKLDKEARENLPDIEKGEKIALSPVSAIKYTLDAYKILFGATAATAVIDVTKDDRKDSIERMFGNENGGNVISSSSNKDTEIKRPSDIPDDWIEVPSDNGGKIWEDPKNPKFNNTRIEPGGKNQENPQPYRKDQRNGQFKDKDGNTVPKKSPEAHQPWEL